MGFTRPQLHRMVNGRNFALISTMECPEPMKRKNILFIMADLEKSSRFLRSKQEINFHRVNFIVQHGLQLVQLINPVDCQTIIQASGDHQIRIVHLDDLFMIIEE